MNTQIETFKQSLYDTINNSQLPVGVVKLILQNTLNNITDLYNQFLQQQAQSINTQNQSIQEEELNEEDE